MRRSDGACSSQANMRSFRHKPETMRETIRLPHQLATGNYLSLGRPLAGERFPRSIGYCVILGLARSIPPKATAPMPRAGNPPPSETLPTSWVGYLAKEFDGIFAKLELRDKDLI